MFKAQAQEVVSKFDAQTGSNGSLLVLSHIQHTDWKVLDKTTGKTAKFTFQNVGGEVVVTETAPYTTPVRGKAAKFQNLPVTADGGEIKIGRWTYPTGRKGSGNTIWRNTKRDGSGEWTKVF